MLQEADALRLPTALVDQSIALSSLCGKAL